MSLHPFFGAIRRSVLFLSVFALGLIAPSVRAQTAADGFDPEVTGTVSSIALQADGKIVIGGTFSQLQPHQTVNFYPASGLARLNLDGSVDTTFAIPTLQNANNASLPAQVNVVVVQPDGKILAGGNFKTSTGQSFLVRFNADGSIDSSFNPVLSSPGGTIPTNGAVTAIAIQPNGGGFSILIGGNFTAVQNGSATAVTRNHVARLTSAGIVDTTWNPNVNAQVDAFALETTGNVLIGGAFTTAGTLTRNHMARVLASGAIDTTYDPNFDNQVSGIALQTDGKAVVVGQFNTATPRQADGTVPSTASTASFVARLNTDGTLDSTFTAQAGASISAVVIEQNGDILLGGDIGTLSASGAATALQSNLARLTPAGLPDPTYTPAFNGQVNALAEQPDGKVIAGGLFTQVVSPKAPNGTRRPGLARVDANGFLDNDFNPNAFGGVGVVYLETDGSYLIGGSFTSVAGVAVRNLAHITTSGAVDPNFRPDPDGPVMSIAVQSDGKVLIGGLFVHPVGASGTEYPYLARLNTNGSLDTTFYPNPNQPVDAMIVQSDGKILIGGTFTYLVPNNDTTAAVGLSNLGRLNPDGTVDTSFEPNPSGSTGGGVYAMLIDSSKNYLIVGGAFSTFTPGSNQITTSQPNLARVGLANGQVDLTWAPNPDRAVHSLAMQPDGQIIAGGEFSQMTPVGTPLDPTTHVQLPTAVRGVARIKTDGNVDTTFLPNPDGTVYAVGVDATNGQVYIGGTFLNVGGKYQPYLARLNTNGTIDKNDKTPGAYTGFGVTLNGPVTAVLPLANHQFVAGGAFTTAIPFGSTTSVPANHVARFNFDGSIDTTFNLQAGFSATINTVVLNSAGQILVGGSFNNIGGTYAANLARFWSDGSFDNTFGADPFGGPSAHVNSVVVESEGTNYYVGGAFTTINSQSVNNLARVLPDGTLDPAFAPAMNGEVYGMAPELTPSMIVVGAFTSVAGVPYSHIARLFTTGTQAGKPDPSFTPNVNGNVYAVAIESDGSILIGGQFTSVSGIPVTNLAHILANGSVDTSFNANIVGGQVNAITVSSGWIFVGGTFTSSNGNGLANLAWLDLQGHNNPLYGSSSAPNGAVNAIAVENGGTLASTKVILGGAFTSVGGQARNHLARIYFASAGAGGGIVAPGTPFLDPSFNPNADDTVNSVAVALDGKVFIGGAFRNVGGLPRAGIARLAATGVSSTQITADATYRTFTWTLGGEVPEISNVLFQVAGDDGNWQGLGAGTRNPGTNSWTITTNAGVVPSGSIFIKVLAEADTNEYASASELGAIGHFFGTPTSVLSSATSINAVANAPFYYEFAATNSPTNYTLNNIPAGLAFNQGLGILSGTVATGTYTLTGTIQNANTSTTTPFTITLTVAPSGASPSADSALINISSRGLVGTGITQTNGFTISGTAAKSVLIRAVGPGLKAFGVPTPLSEPIVTLYDASTGFAIINAQGWDNSQAMRDLAASVGAFPLSTNTTDTSFATQLKPGGYTAIVTTGDGNSGTVLAEVYDADFNPASRLVNISSRGQVDATDNLYAGFVISGSAPRQVIIRGIGPSLSGFGVPTPLPDPVLSIYTSKGALVASNTGWSKAPTVSSGYTAVTTQATLTADFAHVGAFSIDAGSADSAIEITLAPGVYTAVLSTAASNTGTALVEVYDNGN